MYGPVEIVYWWYQFVWVMCACIMCTWSLLQSPICGWHQLCNLLRLSGDFGKRRHVVCAHIWPCGRCQDMHQCHGRCKWNCRSGRAEDKWGSLLAKGWVLKKNFETTCHLNFSPCSVVSSRIVVQMEDVSQYQTLHTTYAMLMPSVLFLPAEVLHLLRSSG